MPIILDTLKETKTELQEIKKVGFPVTDGVMFVNAEEITRCEANGSYRIFYLTNKKRLLPLKA
jgi:hypothetical protein